MATISVLALAPLSATLLSLILAALSAGIARDRTRERKLFTMLNLMSALWTFMYFIEVEAFAGRASVLEPIGSVGFLASVLYTIGYAGSPTAFFLFAAAHTGRRSWVRGWRMLVICVPFAYTLAVALTNPLHHLFVHPADTALGGDLGPLGVVHIVSVYVLLAWALGMVVAHYWRRGTSRSRARALRIAAAAALPVLGGILWMLRGPLQLPLEVYPPPLLYPVFNAVLAYEVVLGGMLGIVPTYVVEAFEWSPDPSVIIDSDMVVLAVNRAAEEMAPGLRTLVRLSDVESRLAGEVAEAIAHGRDLSLFEYEGPAGAYSGVVRKSRACARRSCFVVLLTEHTRLSRLQADLASLRRIICEGFEEKERLFA